MGVVTSDERALEQLAAARLRGARPDELLDLADAAIEQAKAAGDALGLERIAAELDAAASRPGSEAGLRVAAGRARAAVAACAPPPAADRPSEPEAGRSESASAMRRFAAFGLDLILLLAGLLLVLNVGLALVRPAVVLWVVLVWAFLVVPLYFALYHAFGGPGGGPGATPGQHELGLCVCDARTGERPSLRQALLRAYSGRLAALFLRPVVVVRLPAEVRALAPATPTTPELAELFAAGGALRPRARKLARARRGELMTPVLVLYVGLVALATVLVPLMVADLDTYDAADAAVVWTGLAVLMFLSGIYWTQAVLVEAVEAVRIGERLRARDVIRRASQRVNGLTVALLLLAILPGLALTSVYVFLVFIVVAVPLTRCALVVPAIVLEDAPVLRAFARSWRLTRGKTWRAFGLLLASGARLAVTLGVALGVAFAIVGAAIPDPGLWAFCLGAAFALLAASVPVSHALTRVGSAWCLFYYDRRRDDDLRRFAAPTTAGGMPRAAAR